jgi:ketosteroid isomerase-like protein
MVPVNVWVNGDYAYIDYYNLVVIENKEGKRTTKRGKNLDVFLKKGNRWVMVASMTQSDPQEK